MGTEAMAGMSRLAVAEKTGSILADFFPEHQPLPLVPEKGRSEGRTRGPGKTIFAPRVR